MTKATTVRKTIRPAAENISRFIETHYRHFNALTLKDAAVSYKAQLLPSNELSPASVIIQRFPLGSASIAMISFLGIPEFPLLKNVT